ncbi:MAG: endonuclease/exonuclease/phosphatase family protein, partial [Isosphaeraceae bacterium]
MRLLSYNIHKGIGGRDRRYSLERIVQVVAHENPDLVCLQEVDRHVARSRHDDQPHRLAAALEATAHYRQSSHFGLCFDHPKHLSRWTSSTRWTLSRKFSMGNRRDHV